MCGICGKWSDKAERKDDDTFTINCMMEAMRRRGPDGDGFYIDGSSTAGHVRLAIMDPERGRQPIYNETRKTIAIANGEIYNFKNLREELDNEHQFTTGSDSEVLVHLFEDRDVETAKALDGMFALAIMEGDSIYLARDPIGIKPLYTGREAGSNALIFSSEIKAFPRNAENLKPFPPGTWYHSRFGTEQYYHLPAHGPRNRTEDEHISALKSTLITSIHKRLMSDVPLGCFLSGGLDSSIISAAAIRELGLLHTFSVGNEGSTDLEAARLVSKYIGSRHHEYIMTPQDVLKALPDIIYSLESFDQDLVRSAVPCYFTSRLASDYVKVILTGEGADELFGGYTYYKDIENEETLHKELVRSVSALHGVNLQRVDRMTMAHSIEGRVPFLDCGMIDEAFSIPARFKLRGDPPVEKWILRKAFEDYLPYSIAYRKKEQFDEGSGSANLLPNLIEEIFSDEDAAGIIKDYPHIYIRSKEEAYYFKLFIEAYEDAVKFLPLVERWADRPDFIGKKC